MLIVREFNNHSFAAKARKWTYISVPRLIVRNVRQVRRFCVYRHPDSLFTCTVSALVMWFMAWSWPKLHDVTYLRNNFVSQSTLERHFAKRVAERVGLQKPRKHFRVVICCVELCAFHGHRICQCHSRRQLSCVSEGKHKTNKS